ncbi:hypothetical protein TWF718_006655 [Orbilia javanica]|uniref:Uncharacterized protein n=1 Tax=Orbilia javanica TaxID=47235 RepID=A0AAN8RCL7_9PEZI
MWVDGSRRLQLFAGITCFTGYAFANGSTGTGENNTPGGGNGGSNGGITPTWGQSPNRGFTFPNTPYTPQTRMNTLDTSRTSGMGNSLAFGRGNSLLTPPNTNLNTNAGPGLSQLGRAYSNYRPQNYDSSYSMYNSNGGSPDTSGYDSPDGGGGGEDVIPDTEPDELLYPRPREQPKSGFFDNPSQMLEKNLFDREGGITLGTAIKALGIREPEENIQNISPFIDLPKTPPTSGTNTPRYDIVSGQTTPRYDMSGQNTPRHSYGNGDRRMSVYGSPLARDRFTVSEYPMSGVGMGGDDGNVEEEDEEVAINVPVFEEMTGYPGVNVKSKYPGLEFTGPRKVNPVDVDTGTVFMSVGTEREIPADPKIPSLQSIPQDTTDPTYENAFVITPGGASSASTKINAIINEENQMILVAQYEYLNPNPSKWIVDKESGGVLRLAGTPYFVYVCNIPGEKVPFLIGDWNDIKRVSQSCTGQATGRFFYTGWQVVPSTPKSGLPATAAESEVQFNNYKMTSLNKQGLFTIRFPPDKDYLWDTGKDGRIRLPKYVQVTTLPTSKVKNVVGTAMSEDRRFWMYVGNVLPTGNNVLKGWTVANVLSGKPIELQSSIPITYPMSWFLTEVDPEPNHFGSKHKWGSDVVMASLESFPKPGVWSYNATRDRIYKWGTKRFMYTCRSEDKGGAFLLSGLYADALKDCKQKDWIHPVRPIFEDHIGTHGRLSVSLGRGLLWVSPDPEYTTPGFAYNPMGVPLVGRLMTLGKPDYRGMTKKQAAEAKEYREKATMIVEAFVVDVSKTYTQ